MSESNSVDSHFTKTLIFKISFPLVIISLVAFVILGVGVYYLFASVVDRGFQEQSNSTIQVFSNSIREDLIYGLDKEVYVKCQTLMRNKLVFAVSVIGLGGRKICNESQKFSGEGLEKHSKILFDPGGDEVAGRVTIRFKNFLAKQLLSNVIASLVISILFLFLGYWILSFFFLNKQTRQFTNLAEIIGNSNPYVLEHLSNLVPVTNTYELRIFSASVEKLSRNWRSYQEELIKNERLNAANETSRILAHDIKSPLAAIKVVSQVLEQKPEKSKELLARGVQRIEGMLENIVKNDGQKELPEKFEIVDIVSLVEKVIDDFRSVYPDVKIKLIKNTSENRPEVSLVPDLIDRALRNLLKNSIEAFSIRGSSIEIIVNSGKDTVSFSLVDDGPGFPKELIEKVGKTRINSTKKGGSGLGLYQVKKAVQRCSGNLEIFTSPEGTQFIISFPKV